MVYPTYFVSVMIVIWIVYRSRMILFLRSPDDRIIGLEYSGSPVNETRLACFSRVTQNISHMTFSIWRFKIEVQPKWIHYPNLLCDFFCSTHVILSIHLVKIEEDHVETDQIGSATNGCHACPHR
jgi:hypothetical protein